MNVVYKGLKLDEITVAKWHIFTFGILLVGTKKCGISQKEMMKVNYLKINIQMYGSNSHYSKGEVNLRREHIG